MAVKRSVKKLVDDIYKDLGVKVSEDDPLVLLIKYQIDLHNRSVEVFTEKQKEFLKQITSILQAQVKKKKVNWALMISVLNTVFLILILFNM